ncbi:MAG: HAD family phosphatase [Acidobacteria bacterium]|nr:HAD family phosphatase [Acidobacteriota bacterium]MBW4044056.1 HAD family phosphatase [Acidobacteriota bacterium]
MAIRAVIFDYGMVLSTAQEPAAHSNLLAITGLEHAAFEQHYWRHRHEYDLGVLNGNSYWETFSREAELEFTPAQIERLIENDVLMWSTLNEGMLAWVEAVRESGMKTGILSNMGEELLRYMRQEFGWLREFDHHTWSCELGIAKPDPAIYTHTCEKLEVAPQEAVFLDDKPENISAANSVGIHAILFTNIEQLQKDLKARGLIGELPDPLHPAKAARA